MRSFEHADIIRQSYEAAKEVQRLKEAAKNYAAEYIYNAEQPVSLAELSNVTGLPYQNFVSSNFEYYTDKVKRGKGHMFRYCTIKEPIYFVECDKNGNPIGLPKTVMKKRCVWIVMK